MRFAIWLLRAFLFFALFAFALNNSQPVVVRWFFGHVWEAPLVIVVLLAFAIGAGLGMAALMPTRWRRRREAQAVPASVPAPPTEPPGPTPGVVRDGL